MQVLEFSKRYLKRYYNGDYKALINNRDGVLFTDESIKNTFAGGHGTYSDFYRYIGFNREFCKFYDLENEKFI